MYSTITPSPWCLGGCRSHARDDRGGKGSVRRPPWAERQTVAMTEQTTPRSWPALPVDDWADTRDTLQLYTQVVGKVRMANAGLTNHWWNVPLYVTARGLTTSLMPHPTGPSFSVDFDFVDHRLV